jgi:membrane-bound ClpP family serine protease
MEISGGLLALIIIVVVIFAAVSILLILRTYRNKVAAGREDLVGRTAVVKTSLEPTGLVLVQGERWKATLEKGRAGPEEEVIITKVDGLRLYVTQKK